MKAKKSIQALAMLVVGAACFFLQGCTNPHIVFTEVTAADGYAGNVYVVPPGSTIPIPVDNAYGPAIPCGNTSDGRLVLNVQAESEQDIYLADGNSGRVLDRIGGNATCAYVTATDLMIYQQRTIGPQNDIYAIQLGSTIGLPQPIATTSQDEVFFAYSNDNHIIYGRRSYVSAQYYDIMSTTIGGEPVMLAQVFPPGLYPPRFRTVTQDNHVIFDEPIQPEQDVLATYIFSIKTDGTGMATLAQDPNGNELFCTVTPTNRVFYTDQYHITVDGQGETVGDIYSVNSDGTGTVKAIQTGLASYNDLCSGVTPFGSLIFNRGALLDYARGGEQLYSVFPDGLNQPRLLADSQLGTETAISSYYEGSTPWDRVIFSTVVNQNGTLVPALKATNPDGTGGTILTNNFNAALGFTVADDVIYNAPLPEKGPGAYGMFMVPSTGGTPVQLSSSMHFEYLNFLY